jgi:hypothetical protein
MRNVIIILLSVFFCSGSLGDESLYSSREGFDQTISWNKVMLEKDLELMKALLSNDAQVTSAGMQLNGEQEVIEKFEFIFNKRPDLVWVNKPLEIVKFLKWNTAYEYGEWEESWTWEGKITQITGKYFILWQRSNQAWEIKTAVFAPSKCTGTSSYCD